MSGFVFLLMLAVIASVSYDFFSYERRQGKWERDHPHFTYIRGYRKLTKT